MIAAGDRELERRINVSRKWIPGGEPLTAIQRSYVKDGVPAFSTNSIENHSARHQAPTLAKLSMTRAKVELKNIEGEQAIAEVKAKRHYSTDLAELKEIGMDLVRTGDTKVSAAVLAKLIDIEVKIEEKAKDRQFEYEKMLAHFASGAGRIRPDGPIIELPESDGL